MSTLRACDNLNHIGDKLSRIFSELDEGWAHGTMAMRRRNHTSGKLEMQDVDQDSCPTCMGRQVGEEFGPSHIDAGIPALTAAAHSPEYVQFLEWQEAQARKRETDDLDRRIAAAQRAARDADLDR